MITKEDFLENDSVQEFIDWLAGKLDKDFYHSYINRKECAKWSCNSIYNAYEKYIWDKKNFNDNYIHLQKLKHEIRNSIAQNNNSDCKNICLKILKWGGVSQKNKDKIINTTDIVSTLKIAQLKLSTGAIEEKQYYQDIHINSGFSKIYSLCIDDYVIYDSRVGAALGFLVREYCLEKHLNKVPPILKFAYANGRNLNVNRNPSIGCYKFPLLRKDNYIPNNIKANWLLKKILSSPSKFKELPSSMQLQALDAALFMIGYEILNELTY